MIKKKKQMYMVIGAFILILMLFTTAYAFFNYTRTGTANVIKTGRIAFNADQGNNTVTLSDLFPITLGANEEVTASTPGVGSLSIHVTGDTSYNEGIEYLIKAVNVTGDNGTNLPISIAINYEANTGKSIGTEDEDYFTNRGGNTSVYKVLSNDTIEEGKELVVGYIAPDNNGTGIDGTLTIMAYLDARNIAITDTYPEGTVHTVKTTEYSSQNCETALTGVANASTYCTSVSSLQDAIDNGLLTSEQITLLVNAGIVEEYTDGTTDTWVNGRTVLTTEQWNSLQASGVSFQIKAEANEGTWVYTDESCFSTMISNDEIIITNYDINCGTDVVIPNKINGRNVVMIGNGRAFNGYGLTTLVLPKFLETIQSGSITHNNLTSIYISNNVKSLGGGSFAGNRFTKIEIDSPELVFNGGWFSGNPDYGVDVRVNVSNITAGAFANGGGSNVKSVEFGPDVRIIESQSFKLDAMIVNPLLTAVTIPSTVTQWSCNAFNDTVVINNQSGVECTN